MVFSTETCVLMRIYLEIMKFNVIRYICQHGEVVWVMHSQTRAWGSTPGRAAQFLFTFVLFCCFLSLNWTSWKWLTVFVFYWSNSLFKTYPTTFTKKKLTTILRYVLARSMTKFKLFNITAGIYIMLFANSVNFHVSSVDLFLKWKYILVFFYWKVYVNLKYHTNHNYLRLMYFFKQWAVFIM